jgi:hypothetical protein
MNGNGVWGRGLVSLTPFSLSFNFNEFKAEFPGKKGACQANTVKVGKFVNEYKRDE